MPNIKSAEKRMRSTARRAGFNRATKSRAGTLERNFHSQIQEGNKEKASALLPKVIAAYDKAAKKGALHRNRSDHKKSRLTRALNALS